MSVGFKLLISLAVLLIVGEREIAEARRLLKRQTVACYSGSTLLGYCYNGGSCVLVSSNLYQCLCPNGAFALDCSTLSGLATTSSPSSSTCSPSCLNGGVCNSGICFCANGYSGSYCQVAPSNNLCASVTCQNGGVCTVSSNLAYCNCANTGYTGPYCNILASTQVTTAGLPASGSVNPCNSITCLNGGICVVIYGGGYCACASGYTGTTCQNAPATTTASTTPGACNPNPCLNNAPCLNIGGTPTCFCSTGQIPPNCATATTTTTTPATTPYNCNLLPGGNPCLNGAPCLAINNQAVCYCLPGQTPPLCTTTG